MRRIATPPIKKNITHVKAFLHGADRGTITLNGSKKKITILGSGVEAVVFKVDSETDVVKVLSNHFDDAAQHPYLRYINYARRYASSNPYLPRVTLIGRQKVSADVWNQLKEQIAGDDDDSYYELPRELVSLRIERLRPFMDLSIEQLQALTKKTFNKDVEQSDVPSPAYKIIAGLEQLYDTGKITSTNWGFEPDSQLVQALKAIKAIAKKTGADYDIHNKNVMVRFTIGGPQLVITDPLDKTP